MYPRLLASFLAESLSNDILGKSNFSSSNITSICPVASMLNNWFTLYEHKTDGELHTYEWIPDTVAYTYDEAIKLAKHKLKSLEH